MKKIGVLGLLGLALAMSAQSQDFEITERGNVGSGKLPEPKRAKSPTPFKEQEGVVKMIEEYNLIAKGESKKGILKQKRVKDKVDKWLSDGWLKEDDLKAREQ